MSKCAWCADTDSIGSKCDKCGIFVCEDCYESGFYSPMWLKNITGYSTLCDIYDGCLMKIIENALHHSLSHISFN